MKQTRWNPWQHGSFASLGLLLVIVGLSLLVDALDGGEPRAVTLFLFGCSILAFFVFVGIGMVYFKGPGGTGWALPYHVLFWGGGILVALVAVLGFTLAFTADGNRLRYYGGLFMAVVSVGTWVGTVSTYWRGPAHRRRNGEAEAGSGPPP